MENQLRFVSKEEAHKLIDEAPGNRIMVLSYDNVIGISDNGKYIKKKKSKRFVDKSETLVLADTTPIMVLNLHDKFINDFSDYNKEKLSKSILLAKLE